MVITAPGAIVTTLQIGADGYVATVTEPPLGAAMTTVASHLVFDAHDMMMPPTRFPGLLTSMRDARGFPHAFTYDTIGGTGRLTADQAPADPTISPALGSTLQVALPATVATDPRFPWTDITLTTDPSDTDISEAGRQTHHRTRGTRTGAFEWQVAHGATTVTASVPADGDPITIVEADGSQLVVNTQPDPRSEVGMDAPYAARTLLTRPSGVQTLVLRSQSLTPGGAFPLTDSSTIFSDLGSFTLTRTESPASDQTVATTIEVDGFPERTMTVHRTGTRIDRIELPGLGPICLVYPAGTRSHRPSQIQRLAHVSDRCGATPPSRQTQLSYDDDASRGAPGCLRHITTGIGTAAQTTSITPDARGWTSRIRLPGTGSDLVPIFDAHAHLLSVQEPGRGMHGFHYTGRGRLDTYTPPAGGPQTIGTVYRADGRLLTRTFQGDGSGNRDITVSVDSSSGYPTGITTHDEGTMSDVLTLMPENDHGGRPSLISGTMDELGLEWDGPVLGAESWAVGGTRVGRVVHGVDFRMLLAHEQVCVTPASGGCANDTDGQGISYSYDNGRMLSGATLDGAAFGETLVYSFDASADPPAGVVSGTLVTTTVRGLTTQTQLTTLGEYLQSASTDADGAIYQNHVCARDTLGRILRRYEALRHGRSHSPRSADTIVYDYHYDTRGFLDNYQTSRVHGSHDPCAGAPIGGGHWSYDDAGNRADLHVSANDQAMVDGRQYNGMGQLTQAPIDTFTVLRYAYDVLGRLRSTTHHSIGAGPADQTTTYESDPLGRLVGITPPGATGGPVERFVYRDGLDPVGWIRPTTSTMCPGSTDTVYFLYASLQHTPDLMYVDLCSDGGIEETYRLLSDDRGSVRTVVDLQNHDHLVQTIDYDAWGRPSFSPANSEGFQPFGFIGGIWVSDAQIWHLGARDYDPSVGRWTTPDPIGFAGGTNLYAYCSNDPVNCADPTGLLGPFGTAMLGGACAAGLGLDGADVLIAAMVAAAFVAAAPVTLGTAIALGAGLGVLGGAASDVVHDRGYRWTQGGHTAVYVGVIDTPSAFPRWT